MHQSIHLLLLVVSFALLCSQLLVRRKQLVHLLFAAFCGFVVAVIAVVTDGAAVGSGHHHTHALLAAASTEGQTPFVFTGLKFLASWISSWAGVPAGMFGPSLSIGAGLGADVAWLFGSPHTAALIALGMCGFLAGVTQAPITAMIIVMEMTDGHSMVLSLITCALLASAISRMVSRPLYATMAELMTRSWRESPSQGASHPG